MKITNRELVHQKLDQLLNLIADDTDFDLTLTNINIESEAPIDVITTHTVEFVIYKGGEAFVESSWQRVQKFDMLHDINRLLSDTRIELSL